MARVLVVVASRNFRDEEYLDTVRELKAAGHQLTTASSVVGLVRGAPGAWVQSERLVAQCRAQDYDAVILIGGLGALEFVGNRSVSRLVREAAKQGKIVAAICVAPAILAWAGLLRGRYATCHASARQAVTAGGGMLVEEPVVCDPPIVTASGPPAAAEFGRTVAALLRTVTG